MIFSELESILDRETVIKTLREQRDFFDRFSVKTLALFGSTARNEATEKSDIDFLVEFNDELTLALYMNLKFFLEDLFNKKVDLVIQSDLKPSIRDTIIKEAIYVS